MRIRTSNIAAATTVLIFGVAVVIEALQHSMGSMARIGPGFFPLCLGVSLLLLAVVILFDSHEDDSEPLRHIAWRQIFSVSVGIVAFGALIEPVGMVPAATALILISSLANKNSKPMEVLLLALFLPIALSAIFIYGLNMPIKMIDW